MVGYTDFKVLRTQEPILCGLLRMTTYSAFWAAAPMNQVGEQLGATRTCYAEHMTTQADPEFCARCRHERGHHANDVCKVDDCMCIRFVRSVPQKKKS